jgi:hypothetical protein
LSVTTSVTFLKNIAGGHLIRGDRIDEVNIAAIFFEKKTNKK